jgi:hypothetical protein
MEHITSWSMLTTLIYCMKKCIYRKEHKEALLEASRDAGLEVNTEELKHILMSCVKKNKYFEKTIMHQDYIYEEIKNKLNSRNICYHCFQPSHLLCKDYLLFYVDVYRGLSD